MQALIDYDGWRKWKDSKDLKTTLSPVNKAVRNGKKSLPSGKATTSSKSSNASGKVKVKGRAISAAGKALNSKVSNNRKGAGVDNADGAGDDAGDDDGNANMAEEDGAVVEESGVPVFSSIPDGVDDYFVNELGDGDDEADADADGHESRTAAARANSESS